jgi:hypothetical protein
MTDTADPVRSAVSQGAAAAKTSSAGFPWRALVFIAIASFAACAIVDLTYFSHWILVDGSDEARLIGSGKTLLATGAFQVGTDKAFEMPGTAAFFAAIMWLFPAHPVVAIRIVQAFLVGLQSLFVGALAHTLFRATGVAILASVVAGFYPYFVFTQGMALSETLFTAVLMAGFLSLYRWRTTGARIDSGLFGTVALFVAAVMVKATLTFMSPVLVTAGAAGVRHVRSLIAIAIIAAASFALLMTPWWIRNYRELSTFVPYTTTSSLALYAGNTPKNPDANALWPIWDPKVEPAVAIPDELVRSRTFRDMAIKNIEADPAGFVQRAILKFTRFWSIAPRAEAFQKPLYLIVGAGTFGSILLLAIVCAVSQYRRFVEFLPIYLTFAYFTAIYTITVASIRYRLPIEPLLIVLAARPGLTLLSKITGLIRRPFGQVDGLPQQLKYSPTNS